MFTYQRKRFKQINGFESKEQVPKQAYTMGIGTIMSARKILIIISGEDKAEAVKNRLERRYRRMCQHQYFNYIMM